MKRFAIAVLLLCLLLPSCRKAEEPPSNDSKTTAEPAPEVKVLRSEELVGNFPLFPMIEKRHWHDLIEAEKAAADPQATEPERAEAAAKIESIVERLRARHPFAETEDSITLGGITYLKKSRKIEIPAEVDYPRDDDPRHPGELELVLCSEKGRVHETLFVSKARPLHLELLLHLAGFEKLPVMDLFRVSVALPGQESVPIEEFIGSADGLELPKQMAWEFSGGNFQDFYSPDQTGDFLILWHAHPSVLRIQQGKIASGEMKLKAKKHSSFPQGATVTVVIEPLKE